MAVRTVWRMGLVVALGALSVRGVEPDPAFREAKQAFQVQMRKKAPIERASAIAALAEFPTRETADLLVKKGLTDSDADVRTTAQTALRDLCAHEEVSKFLLDELKHAFRKPSASDPVAELLRTLVGIENEAIQTEAVKILDEYLASSAGNLLLPITLIDEYAKRGDEEAFRAVTCLSHSAAFESKFGYRRSIVQAMARINHPEAVTFLILLLPNSKGLIQYDIVQYLTKLTAQRYGDNDRQWYKWWTENKATFEFPKGGVPPGEVPLKDGMKGGKLTYYGIPVCAKRIVFVLDTSGSMRGEPMATAKSTLVTVVEQLPPEINFDVVMFDKTATVWQPRLVPATKEAKTEIVSLIRNRGMGNGTASFAALEAAFGLEPEAIYFLSDGRPTDSQPDQIYNTLVSINKTRRISLYTIGLSTNRNAADLILFMKPLAEQNYGIFKIVE